MARASSYFLPSGARADLPESSAASDDSSREPPRSLLDEAASFSGRLSRRDGSACDLSQLSLEDFHVLRAILRRLGIVAEAALPIVCRNCQERFAVRPCATLELGPFRDGELDDPELDEAFSFDVVHALKPESARNARLAPRTLDDAKPLYRALAEPGELCITSALVRGMGLVELDGQGDPRRIAHELAGASDADFDAVVRLFEAAHYPPRLTTRHVCPDCGAAEWVPAPALREFSVEPGADDRARVAERTNPARSHANHFPTPDAFEQLVRDQAELTYRELGLREIDLIVMDHVAECDDAGEPLLGCYRPGDPEALPAQRPEIRLFYRTFANLWEDEGGYDVRAEVEETLRHELEHHQNFIRGIDPLDEDERAEIDAELGRRVGRREARRRALGEATGDAVDFIRRTWPVWLLALGATLLAVFADR